MVILLYQIKNQYYSIKDPSKIPSFSTNTNISLPESNQQNSNVTDNLPDEEKSSFQISAIVEMRFVFGEQYAKVSFKGIYLVKNYT